MPADAAAALEGIPAPTMTVEPITHRCTPGSKNVLNGWHPGSDLEMSEVRRASMTAKFNPLKFVYQPEVMRDLRTHLERSVADHLPAARILYWT